MRWVTVQTDRGSRACGVAVDRCVDINAADPGLPSDLKTLLKLGRGGLEAASAAVRTGTVGFDLDTARLLPPITAPGKIICLGLNYRDHAIESGATPPEEPVLFSKFASALNGHKGVIVLPAVSQQVDYEAELVVVIGHRGKDIPKERALEYVGGYMCGNDVSARDWQLGKPGKQWLAGKTFDTFAPVGPFLVDASEVPDPHSLPISLRLNGQTMQESNTSQLIFKIDETIAYISKIVTLEPGDLIFTGTPSGVGMARKPPVFLKPGDTTEVEIGGLGILRNSVIAG
ncbi:MAG: fumarylacetoacetate hydrolase family protein [Isosphaeraceae bacterium]